MTDRQHGLLERIVAEKRLAAAARPALTDAERAARWQAASAMPAARGFEAALRRGRGAARPAVIAEFKRRSPSAGALRPGGDAAAIAREYEAAGAAALSILTDHPFFEGTLADLAAARAATSLPVLRKDFLIDEDDLVEARLAGADAALLIVRILTRDALARMITVARRLSLPVLVEAHSDAEVEEALACGATLIGVNHRDLDTLEIDLGLSSRARGLAGAQALIVGESGIRTPDDVARMVAHGVDAILVGEALLRAPSPGEALRALMGGP
jgi:indole-3-glycerol phosphate synthase